MSYRNVSIKCFLKEVALYLTASPRSRIRQLNALRRLDDRLLMDIGVTRSETLTKETLMTFASTFEKNTGGRSIAVRNSTEADLDAIQNIYSHEVLHGLATFEEVPPSAAELGNRRNEVLNLGLPYLVAELDGQVVGYSYANNHRPRPAYRNSIENSVYVAKDVHGRGIGKALLSALIKRCETGTWRQMVAVIGDSGNAGSIGLHERLGFRHVGVLNSVGFKLGRWVDTVIMQRALNDGDGTLPETNKVG